MNKLLSISLCALAFALLACGDDYLIDKDSPKLKQYVYSAPDGFNGDVAAYYDPVTDLYVEQGQTIKFFAGYSAGAHIYTDETLQAYYNGLLWKIGESSYNLNSFRYTFLTPGEFDGSLETTDFYGDTLHTDFKIYVNTPNSITLESPKRCTRPFGRSFSGVELRYEFISLVAIGHEERLTISLESFWLKPPSVSWIRQR